MAYATLAELKLDLGITASDDDSLLTDLLDRATAIIEGVTHRRFVAATETHYFDESAVDGDTLYVDDDLLTVTTLKNGDSDATTLSSDSYWLIPRNETPHYAIKLKSDYSWEFDTDGWVSVTGTWGYSTTPNDDIRHACLRLAAWLYRQRDTGADLDRVFVAEGVAVLPGRLPRDIADILAPYVRIAP